MGGIIPSLHSFLRGVLKPKVTGTVRGRVKIRIRGHLMPENPGMVPSPSTAKFGTGWGVKMGLSNLLPHGGRSYPQSQGSPYLYLFSIPGRISVSNLCGDRILSVRCPELHPFTPSPIPLAAKVWVLAGVLGYTAAILSYCFPQYLNVSIQNLKLFRPTDW